MCLRLTSQLMIKCLYWTQLDRLECFYLFHKLLIFPYKEVDHIIDVLVAVYFVVSKKGAF